MLARISAFVIWALVAATAVFWGLRLAVRSPAAPSYAVPVGDSVAARGDLTRLLGTAPPPAALPAAAAPEAVSRFRLVGLMAPRTAGANGASARNGVALIAVDGKLPRAYTVGSKIDSDLVLQSVSLRTASIAPAPPANGRPLITLELPPLAAAATGLLPPPTLNGGGGGGMPTPLPTPVPGYVPPPPIQPALQPQSAPGLAAPPVPIAPMLPMAPMPRPDGGAPTQ